METQYLSQCFDINDLPGMKVFEDISNLNLDEGSVIARSISSNEAILPSIAYADKSSTILNLKNNTSSITSSRRDRNIQLLPSSSQVNHMTSFSKATSTQDKTDAFNRFNLHTSPFLIGMLQRRSVSLPLSRKVIKEGWIMKRGEHIKNWRRRYFKLREDGTFYGYKNEPKDKLTQPLNNFTVRDCQIISLNRPKPFTFLIRGLQLTNVVERLFFVDNENERTDWLNGIQSVANRLRSTSEQPIPILSMHLGSDVIVDILQRPIRRYGIEDFHLLKVLGKGTFGKVVLCQEKDTGHFYAMKILKKSVLVEKEEVEHTLTENRILQQSRHPFMTQLRYSFTTPDRVCFVMEYVNGGELFYHLSQERLFSVDRARFYGAEITLALGYLHSQNVVYRDLKLENLLLDKDGHIKIADFGLCKEDMHYGALTKTFCGTPEYLAPEVLLDNDYGRAVDWWGLGVVMYEMVCGRLPFYSTDHETLFELILQNPAVLPATLSIATQDFILSLLVKDPSKRLGGGSEDVREVMSHQFFNSIDWERLIRKDVEPPWKPDVKNEFDTKYIPDEFTRETVALTPPERTTFIHPLDGPYFEDFSFHGSRQSLNSRMSGFSFDDHF